MTMARKVQALKLRLPAAAPEPSDGELVAGMRNGEGAAFEKLMRRYNQRIFRSVRSILRDEAEAEDVVQETFVRAFHHLKDFEERSSLATWLMRIAINEALSRLRKSRRFGSLDNQTNQKEDGSFSMESTRPSPEDQASSRELRSILTAAIDSLPQALRIVFVLREIEGLSTLTTSEALQLSSEAVRIRLHRARLTLRRAVEKQVGKEAQALFTFAGARCDRTVAQVFGKVGLPLLTALK